MAISEKDSVLIPEKQEIVPARRNLEDMRAQGTLEYNETLYVKVSQYDSKGVETVVFEEKRGNKQDVAANLMSYNFKVTFVDSPKPKAERIEL